MLFSTSKDIDADKTPNVAVIRVETVYVVANYEATARKHDGQLYWRRRGVAIDRVFKTRAEAERAGEQAGIAMAQVHHNDRAWTAESKVRDLLQQAGE